jgi:hypothetical protein
MNLAKFLQLDEEAKQDMSAARDLGNRMREARDTKQLAEGDFAKAVAAERDHGHAIPARVKSDLETARAEFNRLSAAYNAANDTYAASAQLVANCRAFLLTRGISV